MTKNELIEALDKIPGNPHIGIYVFSNYANALTTIGCKHMVVGRSAVGNIFFFEIQIGKTYSEGQTVDVIILK